MTFADYLARWGSGSGGRYVSSSEETNRRGRLKRAIPIFGDIELSELSRQHVFALQKACIDDGLRPASVNKTMNALRALLTDAEADEEITAEHLTHLFARLRRLKEPKNQNFEPWLLEHRDLILETYEEIHEDHPPYPVLAKLLAYTGMRPGEALGLRWQSLDLDQGTCTIREGRLGSGL